MTILGTRREMIEAGKCLRRAISPAVLAPLGISCSSCHKTNCPSIMFRPGPEKARCFNQQSFLILALNLNLASAKANQREFVPRCSTLPPTPTLSAAERPRCNLIPPTGSNKLSESLMTGMTSMGTLSSHRKFRRRWMFHTCSGQHPAMLRGTIGDVLQVVMRKFSCACPRCHSAI